jgi:predicted Mrr-cat superfamily restriction endonuclease
MLIQPQVAPNTSESLEIWQFGLELKRGDEVLTTNCSAFERALRSGIGSFGR